MITGLAKALAAIIIPILVEAIANEIKKQMPDVIRAVVVAITETMGSIAVKATDTVTDIIPGQLDDNMIDAFTTRVLDQLGRFGH